MFGVYLLYIGLGFGLLLLLAPREGGHEDNSISLTGLMVGWVSYGALILTRIVPRYREAPARLMHFGLALAAYLWA